MKVKLAVIFDQRQNVGGGFSQSFEMVKFLNNNANEYYEPIFFTIFKENLIFFEKEKIEVSFLKINLIQRFLMKLTFYIQNKISKIFFPKIIGISKFESHLLKRNIDLVYFLSPSSWSLYLNKLNYVITVWDLCHKYHPEFPEIRNQNNFEERERFLNLSLKKATAIITDSIETKSNLVKSYDVQDDRVCIIEFKNKFLKHKNILNEKDFINKFDIKNNYILYPAQFWAHKNHIYIIEAIKILIKKFNMKINVVFCGNDQGNLKYIKKNIKDGNLGNLFHILGFVTDMELSILYKNAQALVMPTYFGPNNIPPLEAFSHGTPVFYTDFKGLSADFKSSVFLLDLRDPNSFAQQFYEMMNDKNKKKVKIENGYNYIDSRNKKEKDDLKILNDIFIKFINKSNTWKN